MAADQVLLVDTRQQAGKHAVKDAWFAAHGVATERRKLDFGDYMVAGSNVSVDTKQSVQELAGNVGREHARFVRECERARAAGFRLVVLVEEHPEYANRDLMVGWVPYACRTCMRCRPLTDRGCLRYRGKPLGRARLARVLATIEERHGVRFEFCRREDTALRICRILGVRHT